MLSRGIILGENQVKSEKLQPLSLATHLHSKSPANRKYKKVALLKCASNALMPGLKTDFQTLRRDCSG